jgi:hypothetical protein
MVAFEPSEAVEANLDPRLSVKADGQQQVAVDFQPVVQAMANCKLLLVANCRPQGGE